MAAVGGDILEINYNHPTLGSGTWFPKSGEDSTFDLGGFRSADDENMIDGGGEQIIQLSRKLWSAEMTVAWDNNVREELEAVVALAGDPVNADYTITHVSGAVYKGKGRPVGDLKGNGNAATFPLKLQGGGQLKKQ